MTTNETRSFADGELSALIRHKLAIEEAHVELLGTAATRIVLAHEDLAAAILRAHHAGMTNRAIARAAGVTHPTVAKIVRGAS